MATTQTPQVLELIESIKRLGKGNAIIIGGLFDVNYLSEKISKLQSDPSIPQETTRGLVEMLDQVDPELSTWKMRKDSLLKQMSKINFDPDISQATTRENYVKRYKIEEGVIDTLGLETLRTSKVLYSDYWVLSPFIAKLPESLTSAQVERLTKIGYESVGLERNEALALFFNAGIVRRAEKLQEDQRYLDKKIGEFIEREAGNYGDMYFIGPISDHKEEIDKILSPKSVDIHSSYVGMSMNRKVKNLIGVIPEGTTVYRKETKVFIVPND